MNESATSGEAGRETLAKVLGKTPSGLHILIAGDGTGNTTGMLASWVQQASFEPPAVTVAVNKKRYINDWLSKHPHVVLNLVGESQNEFLKQFGKGFEPDEPAFEGIVTGTADNGLPTLTEALGYLEGTIKGQLESGDHLIYLIELSGAGTEDEESLAKASPWTHIRKTGFSY
ncbi:Diflavin flavoprotein A 1 [Polystyrenella longa]|uniref:Diflavin flavoprotein A 1 n=1 Tax=Polystyrenella longa TaxID=2528007 RepID=A0A518CNQ6_9PLAN|nr:flavin reductase family protein [Polystyrenella longa]QDU80857.1 Diflavin flavoprotein A 1 [Polystyrenella longa]